MDEDEDEQATARALLGGRRLYINDDGVISEPIGVWADGTDRLPNYHNSWYLLVGDPDGPPYPDQELWLPTRP
ncbi:hypothetical protein J2X63_003198 [Agromyces sp. 3263]|uniref:hypothetical protein n=1 Tax=Agromyces sp. 3263 TaxID=2817750 RepID=UPI00285A3EFF|nr:hypothetical protein [Agromyces sp. 3263]MDR6907490.1 hypothetical protein [Agromyces sp. 3263]